jgi:signal transduction histidine kinase/DNA-binding response OmpR family regulator
MNQQIITLEIRYENDVVSARQKARLIAAALKFDKQDQIRIATAVSEIARNAFQYAVGGRVAFAVETKKERLFVITIQDRGKGIPNVEEILSGKYVSQTGMGKGVLGAYRLMDRFHVDTTPGGGTTVTMAKALPPSFEALAPNELNALLQSLATSQQSPYGEMREQNKELLRTLEELKSKQSELSQLNRELDETNRGVVALYAELNDKAEFLQRASEMKSNFLSNMSHEFRTPLNSILALTQILLDRLDGDLTAEQEKQVRFVRSAAQSLTELVSDLLDIAKVEAGKVSMRPAAFTVESLFAALRGMLRPLLNQHSAVSLIFEDAGHIPEMNTDEAKVSQILRNFISNALKFTERGEVRVSAEMGDGDTVLLSVSDTGIGINAEDQERIFKEWAQVEGRLQKAANGSGLGLPLSRRLAQLLGGNVFVKSKPGLGSTFVCQLPIAFEGATEVAYVPDEGRELDASKLPVLVVDDSLEVLFIYEKYLRGTPFQMVPARTLADARKALEKFRPVAVVLDVLLDGEQTWELLSELKSVESTASIPVVVVTVGENEAKALEMGADGFHSKPVDKAWLLSHLNAGAGRKGNLRALVVDDHEASRYLTKAALAELKMHIIEAGSGSEGLRIASDLQPDLIVLDLVMPDLSGIDVLSELKADPRTSKIPVIIHTSQTLTEEDRRALEPAAGIVAKRGQSIQELRAEFTEIASQVRLAVRQ